MASSGPPTSSSTKPTFHLSLHHRSMRSRDCYLSKCPHMWHLLYIANPFRRWWSVFWVLFTAKSNGQGPEDALLYTQVRLKSRYLSTGPWCELDLGSAIAPGCNPGCRAKAQQDRPCPSPLPGERRSTTSSDGTPAQRDRAPGPSAATGREHAQRRSEQHPLSGQRNASEWCTRNVSRSSRRGPSSIARQRASSSTRPTPATTRTERRPVPFTDDGALAAKHTRRLSAGQCCRRYGPCRH